MDTRQRAAASGEPAGTRPCARQQPRDALLYHSTHPSPLSCHFLRSAGAPSSGGVIARTASDTTMTPDGKPPALGCAHAGQRTNVCKTLAMHPVPLSRHFLRSAGAPSTAVVRPGGASRAFASEHLVARLQQVLAEIEAQVESVPAAVLVMAARRLDLLAAPHGIPPPQLDAGAVSLGASASSGAAAASSQLPRVVRSPDSLCPRPCASVALRRACVWLCAPAGAGLPVPVDCDRVEPWLCASSGAGLPVPIGCCLVLPTGAPKGVIP
jgi:hypothetical protein